jgi:energy-coupling factor transport system substrate-specific component
VPEVINYSVENPYVSVWLEGFDKEPQVMLQSELGELSYMNLPTGDYTFHLAVLDAKGKSVLAESTYEIIREKDIYDNWWFVVYMILVFTLAVIYLTWLLFRTQIQKTLDMQKRELELARQQLEMGNETILTIARTVDARDENTSQHSRRVSEYSVLIAQRLGFSPKECDELRRCALLHDIGKIGIPDQVLNKPARLTDEEYEIMKSHVVKGAEILKSFTLLPHVEEGALYHHERYDGKGYVHRLKGEEIPINARIIGIADAFDAMTANRVYRKKLDLDYVLGELKRCRGSQFDPKLVDILLELIETGVVDVEQIYGMEG